MNISELLIDYEILLENAKILAEEAIGLCIDCYAKNLVTKEHITRTLNIRYALATNSNLSIASLDKAVTNLDILIEECLGLLEQAK